MDSTAVRKSEWRQLRGTRFAVGMHRATAFSKRFRSTDEVQTFLRPRLSSLSDPFLLPQMRAAVARILGALDSHERIVLFGDYDVDGVTSLALLAEMLRAYGATPNFFYLCGWRKATG
jgi:hypothetical protein